MRTCSWCSKQFFHVMGASPNFCSKKCQDLWNEQVQSVKPRPKLDFKLSDTRIIAKF